MTSACNYMNNIGIQIRLVSKFKFIFIRYDNENLVSDVTCIYSYERGYDFVRNLIEFDCFYSGMYRYEAGVGFVLPHEEGFRVVPFRGVSTQRFKFAAKICELVLDQQEIVFFLSIHEEEEEYDGARLCAAAKLPSRV